MGQALDDLPDPINSTSLGTATSADDLLARLAGEEIDRLLADESLGEGAELAEATAEPDPLLPPSKTEPEAVDAPDPETARQLDELFAQLVDTDSGNAPAPARQPTTSPASATVADSVLSQQLDDLFAPLEAEPADSAAPAPRPAPLAAPAQPAVPAEAPEATTSVDPADQTGALERQVLAADLLESQESAENAPVEDEAVDDQPAEPRVPICLRLLELLNAPLANVSETVRNVLGKAAVVTLVNALLILIYVLFVR